MDNSTVENYQRQAKEAGPFRKVPVSSKHLLELTKFWQAHQPVSPVLGPENGAWENKQVNRYASVETMG